MSGNLITMFLKTIKNFTFKKKLTVLFWGNSARDHAIAWKLSKSKRLKKLYLTNPNDGFKDLGERIYADGYKLIDVAKEKGVDLLVVGAENAQMMGIVDAFNKVGIKAIGLTKEWSKLELSKVYGKEFMVRNNIPIPKFKIVTKLEELDSCIAELGLPIVLKADGPAFGFGVVIAYSHDEAKNVLEEFLNGKYGESSKTVVIEEFIDGKEISLMSLWDGETLTPFVPARDYKKLSEGDKGPNTGGMGAYCPVILTEKEQQELSQYHEKLKQALFKEKAAFAGILFSGLIMNESGLKVLEYNIRLGDPEGQALLMHLDSDLLDVFDLMTQKKLSQVELKWKKGTSACVLVACDGYPENPKKGGEISNINSKNSKNIQIFYSSITKEDKLIASGGRVLSVCKTSESPYEEIYKVIEEIDFKDKLYRKDIGS